MTLLAAAARGPSTLAVAGVGLIAAYASLVGWAGSWATYDLWVALVVLPPFLLLNVPMIVNAGKRDPDPRFLRLLATVFVLKLGAAAARYWMAFVLYDGVADAGVYHNEGARLAGAYRDGLFDTAIGRDFVGTGFIRVLTGAIYTISGPSIYVAYAVYSVIGFWGLYFLYRAFRVGVPDGDARRYSLLVLLLPSMLFWPSGLGKEAWMTLAIGLTAYGAALLLSGHRRWAVPLILGCLAGGVVRPHIVAALAVAVVCAYLLGKSTRPRTAVTPIFRGIAMIVLVAGALAAVSRAAEFLDVGSVTASNVDAAIDDTGDSTSTGDSKFATVGVDSPVDFPMATLTVLFRPFPTEADNPQMMLAAAEGSLLLVLLSLSVRRLRTLPRRLRRQPYLIFCAAYAGFFIYAFSNFSNFGLLTRERVQVLPFVLVLFALTAVAPSAPRPEPSNTARQGAPA